MAIRIGIDGTSPAPATTDCRPNRLPSASIVPAFRGAGSQRFACGLPSDLETRGRGRWGCELAGSEDRGVEGDPRRGLATDRPMRRRSSARLPGSDCSTGRDDPRSVAAPLATIAAKGRLAHGVPGGPTIQQELRVKNRLPKRLAADLWTARLPSGFAEGVGRLDGASESTASSLPARLGWRRRSIWHRH